MDMILNLPERLNKPIFLKAKEEPDSIASTGFHQGEKENLNHTYYYDNDSRRFVGVTSINRAYSFCVHALCLTQKDRPSPSWVQLYDIQV